MRGFHSFPSKPTQVHHKQMFSFIIDKVDKTPQINSLLGKLKLF